MRLFQLLLYFVLQEECEQNLAVAMPALNAAIKALDTLKQSDITIIKSMSNPPQGIKLVMESICIMKVSHLTLSGHRAWW